MNFASAAAILLYVVGATPAHGQVGSRPAGSIPAQFHGRWAEDQRACRPRHFTNVITITSKGWSSFETGGEITRVGRVRRGTHYFRLNNRVGEEKVTGSLALRRDGARLLMTLDDDNARPLHHRLVRCR